MAWNLFTYYTSIFLSSGGSNGQKDTSIEDEVRYRYNSVITHYRKSFVQDNVQRVSPITFELEATLKLTRFLCRRELTKEVVESVTNAADGAKSLIDASDRLILYVEIARLFGSLGYQRKAAFFSRQVAQLYLQQENRFAATSAMQVLAMTTKAYRVQSRASNANHSISNETESGHTDRGKLHHHSAVSLFESQWSTLQMVVLVLREILLSAVRAGDPLTSWSAAARLLRSYYPLITPAGQNGLANALENAAVRLPSGTRCVDPALPFIRFFLLTSPSIKFFCRAREDWWEGSAPSGPFIYTPFSKGEPSDNSKQDLVWIVGEPVQVFVELANPCGFDLKVDSIYLSVQSGNFDAFPLSVDLLPNSSLVIMLSGIPTSVRRVVIPGCTVHCFGVITEHHFKDVDNLLLGAAQGLVLSDPFRCCGSPRLRNVSELNISVIPPLPLLVSHIVGVAGSIVLYEGEIPDLWITLANAGTIAVEQSDTAAGKSVSGSMGRTVKEGSCPSLLIHYAARLLSMEIPAHVGGSPSNLANGDGNPSDEAVGYGSKRLVKIYPFRGSWGLRFLELEMSNPTDVVFEINVSVLEKPSNEGNVSVDYAEKYDYPKTRIDREYFSRVLIPLEHFKLPFLDDSFFSKDLQSDESTGGRNSSGELNITDAIRAALQSSIMDILLPDPLTFGFRLARNGSENATKLDSPLESDTSTQRSASKNPGIAHDMTPMEVLIRNNTKETVKTSLRCYRQRCSGTELC
ncbi:TRS120 protein [Hibiscus syriacus]|uniref:TRS120 protein n=1 Tax=Hibiscus syriacus TaxID=106335 RepID=A0A6A2WUN6_HIBSY|nr:TRS120 protein [Hibiscus syriacus]